MSVRVPLVVLTSAIWVGCATAPIRRTTRVDKDAPAVIVLAKELSARGRARAYASGLGPAAQVDSLTLDAGHSANTATLVAAVVTSERVLPSAFVVSTLGAVPSAEIDGKSEHWRQGHKRVFSRPPRHALDRFGRLHVGAPRLAVELDLGIRPAPNKRRDTALVSLIASGPAAGETRRLETAGGVFDVDGIDGAIDLFAVGGWLDPTSVTAEGFTAATSTSPDGPAAVDVTFVGRLRTTAPVTVAASGSRYAGALVMLPAGTKPQLGLPMPAGPAEAQFSYLSKTVAARRGAATGTKAERRAELRDILEIGDPQPGWLLTRDDVVHLLVEDYALPTPSGTRGAMRIVRTKTLQTPAPAVLYLCGHFPAGVRHPDVQRFLREAARAGFVAGAVDLLGQGYRLGPEAAHVTSAFLTLAGRSAIRPLVEEAEAGLATLLDHAAVDPTRVGVTGISMGGTLALIVGALSERVSAVTVMAATPDFEAYARPIGSDAEQHSWRFAARGGLAALPELVAPRPLRILFAQHDGDHGASSSEGVVAAARSAYGDSQALSVKQGRGLHNQEALARSDLIAELQVDLRSVTSTGAPADAWLPPVPTTVDEFVGYRTLAQRALQTLGQVDGATYDRLVTTPFAGEPRLLGQTGSASELVSLPGGDDGVRTTMWRLRRAGAPRVFMLDDGGRGGAAFAPLLHRCGFEVVVSEPRTFGTAASWNEAWHRKLLSLASVSADAPLAIELVRDVITAVRAAGPIDVLMANGPDAGALALMVASTGALDGAHVVLGDAPSPLRHRLAHDRAPYWSVLLPGLLAQTDLDRIAGRLSARGDLTVASGGEGLVEGGAPAEDPARGRALAAQVLLRRYAVESCMVELPVAP